MCKPTLLNVITVVVLVRWRFLVVIDEFQLKIKDRVRIVIILLFRYLFCCFAFSWLALDGLVPFLFEVREGVAVYFVVEGAEVGEDSDGGRGRRRPFVEVEVGGGSEEDVLGLLVR
jgi:hypothetical protein